MYAKRKKAKDFLKSSTLHEYHRIIREAKLTRRQGNCDVRRMAHQQREFC